MPDSFDDPLIPSVMGLETGSEPSGETLPMSAMDLINGAEVSLRAADAPRQTVLSILAGTDPMRGFRQITNPSEQVEGDEVTMNLLPELKDRPNLRGLIGAGFDMGDPAMLKNIAKGAVALGIGKFGAKKALKGDAVMDVIRHENSIPGIGEVSGNSVLKVPSGTSKLGVTRSLDTPSEVGNTVRRVERYYEQVPSATNRTEYLSPRGVPLAVRPSADDVSMSGRGIVPAMREKDVLPLRILANVDEEAFHTIQGKVDAAGRKLRLGDYREARDVLVTKHNFVSIEDLSSGSYQEFERVKDNFGIPHQARFRFDPTEENVENVIAYVERHADLFEDIEIVQQVAGKPPRNVRSYKIPDGQFEYKDGTASASEWALVRLNKLLDRARGE